MTDTSHLEEEDILLSDQALEALEPEIPSHKPPSSSDSSSSSSSSSSSQALPIGVADTPPTGEDVEMITPSKEWSSFDDMYAAVRLFAQQRGFQVTLRTCSVRKVTMSQQSDPNSQADSEAVAEVGVVPVSVAVSGADAVAVSEDGSVVSEPVPVSSSQPVSMTSTISIPTSGYFNCEFFPPRAGTNKSSTAITGEKPHRLTQDQQQLCDTNTRCCTWTVRFGQRIGRYHLNNPQQLLAAHIGHRMRREGLEREVLHTIKRVPQVVIDRVSTLLERRLESTAIRKFIDEEFADLKLSDVLFSTVLTRGRAILGLGQPGEVQQLREFFKLQVGSGAVYNDRTDESSRCDAIFFMSAQMKAMFCRLGQFLIMDATCKTNRFGLMLVLVTGVNQIGKTILLAVGLLAKENGELYSWLLSNIKAVVGQLTMKHTMHSTMKLILNAIHGIRYESRCEAC